MRQKIKAQTISEQLQTPIVVCPRCGADVKVEPNGTLMVHVSFIGPESDYCPCEMPEGESQVILPREVEEWIRDQVENYRACWSEEYVARKVLDMLPRHLPGLVLAAVWRFAARRQAEARDLYRSVMRQDPVACAGHEEVAMVMMGEARKEDLGL